MKLSGLSKLVALLNRENQRFECVSPGSFETGSDRFTACVKHIVEPPALGAGSVALMRRIRAIPQLVELYETYGSVRLYCDTIGDDSAFYLAPIEQWPYLKEGFSLWLEGLTDSEKEELLPEWITSYVVFGEIPQSGNYFLMPMAGEKIGQVFEFGHDGFEFIKRGRDVDEFLGYISTVNDALIEDILTYTRYSDGISDIQWLASKYLFDESAL